MATIFDTNKIQQPRKAYTIINDEFNTAIMQELDGEQKKLLQQFVDQLKSDFPEDVKDIFTLVRFLRARKWNLQAAGEQYRKRMAWIAEYKPHLITESDVAEQIKTGKLFLLGRDKEGRPILFLRPKRHVTAKEKNIDDTVRYFIYLAEIAVQMFNKPPNHKLSIFVDRRGSSLSNFDHRMVTKLMPMQDYYPDIVSTIYIIGANWIYEIVYKISSKMMDPVTVKKIQVLSSNFEECKKQLAADIVLNKHQLPMDMGGTLTSATKNCYLPTSMPSSLIFEENAASTPMENKSKEEIDKLAMEYEKSISEDDVKNLELD